MDEIQKVLIKIGRKDLAQKYYLKISDSIPDEKIKIYFSKKILPEIKDKSLQNIIRETVFYFGKIQWRNVLDSIYYHRPEVQKEGIDI